MEVDQEKIDEVVMGLMKLTMFEEAGITRSWKGYAWDVLDRLHVKGWIHDPRSKTRSVVITDMGKAKASEFCARHFGKSV